MYFIFLETRIIGLHFAANSVDLSSFKFFWWAPQFSYVRKSDVLAVQGHPRSLILASIEKRVCDFLLVRHGNLGSILHRFGDIAGFTVLLTPPLFRLILGVFLLDQIAHVGVSWSMSLKLFGREIIIEVF